MNYLEQVLTSVANRNPNEPEFLQAVKEVFDSLGPVLSAHSEYERTNLLSRMAEPERMISFRVVWTDDAGQVQVNRGYRVQFNGALGPYKGGLRFHPSVNTAIIKFLGFEQTFKNSLTGLPLGGGKGGSDFDPRCKSDDEVMRFCQAFMSELYRHIGPSCDVPAGDIGVGGREIGYLYGQYRRLRGSNDQGVLTGKGLSFGGSLLRPEATGYGAVYYAQQVFAHRGEEIRGKTFALSGFGNVAWGAAKKIAQLGAKAVTISGPDGYVYDADGIITPEKLDYMLQMRTACGDKVQAYAEKFSVPYFPGEKPWGIQVDVCMPCATQNEVAVEDAKRILQSDCAYYLEVSNMPTTPEATALLRQSEHLVFAPAKAVNAGGVAVSGLEMAQNSMRYAWTEAEVDQKLHHIMKDIHDHSVQAAESYGLGYNLVDGANIAGFRKVADAMLAQGLL